MTPSILTPQQFIVWRKGLGMSQSAAAKRLGISLSSVYNYELGKRADEGDVKIPLLVCLGMSAVLNGLQPYNGENNADSIENSPQS